jgi:hypothetical protein
MKERDMKNNVSRKTLLAGVTLLGFILAGGSLGMVLAQDGEARAIVRAQEAVRQRIMSQERGRIIREGVRNPTVHFNHDAQTVSKSRTEIRVRGTGTFSQTDGSRSNNSRGNPRNRDSRYEGEQSRDFTYEATVGNSNRYSRVSEIRYDWNGDWATNRGYGANDDRRGNNRDSYGVGNRPNGRVSYSGPIMNRHSDKALDVTERSNRDGANIQQWSYADQPNQNWEVIDLGNRQVAIISRQSGKALTVQGGRDNNGANIIQLGWNGSRQQRWRLEQLGGDYYRIVSIDNGKCLDVTEQSKQDGARVQLWDSVNHPNQQWRLRR